MRALLVISAIAILGAGPGVVLADPSDPDGDPNNGLTCISTDCKEVVDPGDLLNPPELPPPTICMELVADDSIPPEDQWDGCILP